MADNEAVRRVLDEAVSTGVTPGIVVEVLRDGARWFASAGKADLATGRERRPGELFRIGSAAKAFTAATVLKLAGEGVLGLGDTVHKWLPGLLDGSPYDGRAITLRQLLNQTSGLYNFSMDPGFFASGQGEAWYERRFTTFTPEELVRIALRHPPVNPPGQAFRYSNTQYYLAAMMVERATGEPYGEVLDRLVLRPLELTGTSLPTTRTLIPGPHPVHYSRLYVDDPAAPLHDASESNTTTGWSAGGMISSTGDLLTFFSALLSGRLFGPAQLAEMYTTVPTDGSGWLPGTRYGLGVWVEQKLGSGVHVWGNGGADYGTFTLVLGSRDGTHLVACHVNTDWSPEAYATFLAVLDLEFGWPAATR
ncbi:D-alanyl-D-alanine carboxypeptidase [Nonomuraea thailandensis]|uniref:D-alanyl-D-alanine carboxypeptidase n=1 Tax=Nonomuraea thailandensis TaxID=1188745 RepID=A0A9X2KCL4_9ACTN|nr:serine hydrolase domain-containing protein [Nonomuraea thailandensis]MCP2365171.1 D-alanyl-D-alanine carboxypeptidase [Nonomuraea thailandensis]